jgi:hypothetical protein
MGRRHYSGKELIMRRQLERQQAEQKANPGNGMTKTLRQVNALRPAMERAKQRMREGKDNGSVLD